MNLFQQFYDKDKQHFINFMEIRETSIHFMLYKACSDDFICSKEEGAEGFKKTKTLVAILLKTSYSSNITDITYGVLIDFNKNTQLYVSGIQSEVN